MYSLITCQLEKSLVEAMPSIMAFIASKISNHHDREDILQDVLLRTLKYADRSEIKNVQSYAMNVCKSAIVDHWKNHTVGHDLNDCCEHEDNTSDLFSSESSHRKLLDTAKAIQKMPQLRRIVFLNKRLDGKSRKEIAEVHRISEESVKKHISRASADLKSYLNGAGWLS